MINFVVFRKITTTTVKKNLKFCHLNNKNNNFSSETNMNNVLDDITQILVILRMDLKYYEC